MKECACGDMFVFLCVKVHILSGSTIFIACQLIKDESNYFVCRYRFSTDSAEASFYDKKEKEIFSKISYTQTGKEEEEEEKSSAAVPVEAPPISDRPQTPPTAIKSKEDPYGGSTDNESDMEMQEQPGGCGLYY